MATKAWIGGGDNRASNPLDWGPSGTPRPGDTLTALPLTATEYSYTMNISGNDLAGDQLIVGRAGRFLPGSHTTFAGNLTNGAVGAVSTINTDATFDLSGGSVLGLVATSDPATGVDTTTINASGFDVLYMRDTASNVTLNIARGSIVAGSVAVLPTSFPAGFFPNDSSGTLTVNGSPVSAFWNFATSSVGHDQHIRMFADVIGTGTFNITSASIGANGSMEFSGGVASTQSITDAGRLVIDNAAADRFQGHITLAASASATPAEVDLVEFASASSYSFQNDILSIYVGNRVANQLHFTDDTPSGFIVKNITTGVGIFQITDPAHPPGDALPVHV